MFLLIVILFSMLMYEYIMYLYYVAVFCLLHSTITPQPLKPLMGGFNRMYLLFYSNKFANRKEFLYEHNANSMLIFSKTLILIYK